MARNRIALRLLRTTFLLIFLGSVGAVGYLLYMQQEQLPSFSTDPESEQTESESEIAIAGTRFRQAVTQEDRVAFEIEGESYRVDRQDNVEIEGVLIRLDRSEGQYEITGDRGFYRPGDQAARLTGNVVVHAPRGLVLWTDALEVASGGTSLEASRGSRFRIGNAASGSAEEVSINSTEDLVLLSGGVELDSLPEIFPSFSLRSERIAYRADRRLIRAQGNVRMRRAEDLLQASRLSIYLHEVTDEIRFVRALWRVRGRVNVSDLAATPQWEIDEWFGSDEIVEVEAGADEQTRLAVADLPVAAPDVLRFRSTSLALELDQGRVVTLDLEGHSTTPASLWGSAADGVQRRLEAVHLRTYFRSGGQIETIEAVGPVEVLEYARPDGDESPLVDRIHRRMSAQRARAEFDEQGQMTLLDLEDDVQLQEGTLQASGDAAKFRTLQEYAELIGTPVRVFTEDGEFEAPAVTYNQATGLVHSQGGVRTTFTGVKGALDASPLGAADGPVLVESEEAQVRRGSNEFLFRGSVRAWRGDNYLLADQLRGDQNGMQLAASGRVKTLWHRGTDLAAEVTAGDEGEQSSDEDVEITADHMTYAREDGDLHYAGSVFASQYGSEIHCDIMDVILDEDQEAQFLVCDGDAEIRDPESGRNVRGIRATYTIASGEVRIEGEPVVLTDPALGRLQGFELWYRLEDGLFKLGSPPPPPPEPGDPEAGITTP